MNKLKITKRDWFENFTFMSPVFQELGEYPIPNQFVETFNNVHQIIQYDENNPNWTNDILFFYDLTFPEIFFPRNMSVFFWNKVGKLMKKGIVFHVTTSDLRAVGWVTSTRYEKDETSQSEIKITGWDERVLERYYRDTNEWREIKITKGYGRTMQDLEFDLTF